MKISPANSFMFLRSKISALLMVSLVISVTACGGGGGSNSGSDPTDPIDPTDPVDPIDPNDPSDLESLFVQLLFPGGLPAFFAWRDGEGDWERAAALSGNSLQLEITDADGRFSIAGYCAFRGRTRGYIYNTTAIEIPEISFRCDPTTDTTDYTVSGNLANALSAEIYYGRDFLNNKLSLFNNGAFDYNITDHDNDDETKADFLSIGFNFGSQHYRVTRGLDYSLNPTGIDHTLDPGEVPRLFDVDISSVRSFPDFDSYRLKIMLGNTQARTIEQGAPDNIAGEKLPASQADPDDIYNSSILQKGDVDGMTTYFGRLFNFDSDPTSLRYTTFANTLPAISFDDNVGGAIRASFATTYETGFTSYRVRLCHIMTASLDIEWDIWYTPGAMTPGEPPVLEFDSGLMALPGYDTTLTPTTINLDMAKIEVFGSPSDTPRLHGLLNREFRTNAGDDGLDFSRVGITHQF